MVGVGGKIPIGGIGGELGLVFVYCRLLRGSALRYWEVSVQPPLHVVRSWSPPWPRATELVKQTNIIANIVTIRIPILPISQFV